VLLFDVVVVVLVVHVVDVSVIFVTPFCVFS